MASDPELTRGRWVQDPKTGELVKSTEPLTPYVERTAEDWAARVRREHEIDRDRFPGTRA